MALNALNSEAQLAPEDSDLELGKSIPGNICERMKPSEGGSLWGVTDTLMEGAVAQASPCGGGGRGTGNKPVQPVSVLDARSCEQKMPK